MVTLHMVSSLDGFISKKDGSISWMKSTDKYSKGKKLTKAYIKDFLDSVDCYIMGSKTYEGALNLGWPYGDKPVVVTTKRTLKKQNEHIEFYSGNLHSLVNNQLSSKYQNIWVVGGAELTKSFLQLNLVDEIVITYVPIILGDGVLFFDFVDVEKQLHLKNVEAFDDGMVEITYQILKP